MTPAQQRDHKNLILVYQTLWRIMPAAMKDYMAYYCPTSKYNRVFKHTLQHKQQTLQQLTN